MLRNKRPPKTQWLETTVIYGPRCVGQLIWAELGPGGFASPVCPPPLPLGISGLAGQSLSMAVMEVSGSKQASTRSPEAQAWS